MKWEFRGDASFPASDAKGTDRVQTPRHRLTALLVLTSMLLQGCAAGPFRLQYLWQSDEELSYYVDKATAIEYPVETCPEPTDPALFNAPRDIRTLDEADPREIGLNECIRMALAEATIILDDASLGSPGNPVLSRPAQVASVYDSAIQNTGYLFGNRGVEAALADFDALATSTITWGRDEVPQNVANSGIGAGSSLTQESMAWSSRLEKPLANGGQVSLQSDVNYDGNNRSLGIIDPTTGMGSTQAYSSTYSGLIQAEYRQPLWAGAGVEFNRIAGPQNQSLRGVSGVSQGVLISRINSDISLTQFEQSVATLIRDVEQRYWDLDLALRLYDSEKEAFEQLVEYFYVLKSRKGDSGDVPILQAEARVYEADARLRGSLADVLDKEARLRRLCHLPLNDGEFLYPSDRPVEAEFQPLWEASLQEALAHRTELRRQKWEIKSLELQLTAAQNLTRPRLDMVTQYRRNGLGNRMAGDGNTLGSSIGSGQNEGWNIGLQWSMPVGLRLARIQERNYELRLRKAKAVLGEQEREIAYELSTSMREMQRWYELADSTTRRIETSRAYADATDRLVFAQENRNHEMIGSLLQARIQQRDAEQAYMRSIIEYNKAMTDFRFRKGTLLVDNEVYLAEGNWHPAAANDALHRAEARTHAKDAHKLRTEPMEFVGQAAPGSWEALGTNTRPSIPGALEGDAVQPLYGPAPGQPVPQAPPMQNFEPAPAPPADEPVPPAKELTPKPVPPSEDSLTFQARTLQAIQRASQLAPVSEQSSDNADTAGRVEL